MLLFGIALVVAGELALVGGPHRHLPFAGDLTYVVVGAVIAASSTWWFGWLDRAGKPRAAGGPKRHDGA